MRQDHRRGETFHELRQAQEQARQGHRSQRPGIPPAVGRITRIVVVSLFGLGLMWLLQQANVPPLFRTVALGVVGIVVLIDILRLIFD